MNLKQIIYLILSIIIIILLPLTYYLGDSLEIFNHIFAINVMLNVINIVFFPWILLLLENNDYFRGVEE